MIVLRGDDACIPDKSNSGGSRKDFGAKRKCYMKCRADEIMTILKEAGVDLVFGIPSIHNLSLYEALRNEPSIRHILCRQESSAAHMADGYARASGKLGVVITSTGPGFG